MPYRYLLPTQIVFLIVMTAMAVMLLPVGIAASAFIWWPRKREIGVIQA